MFLKVRPKTQTYNLFYVRLIYIGNNDCVSLEIQIKKIIYEQTYLSMYITLEIEIEK